MKVVRIGGSIAHPEPSAQAALTLVPFLGGELLAIGGAIHGILVGRGVGEILIWSTAGTLFPIIMIGIFSRKLRAVRETMAEIVVADPGVTVYPFVDAGTAFRISSWRDWREGDRLRAGVLTLSKTGIVVRSDSGEFSYSYDDVSSIETWVMWTLLVWAPQICIRFADSRTLVIAPAHVGLRGVWAFSKRDLRMLEQDLERRAPGLTSRHR